VTRLGFEETIEDKVTNEKVKVKDTDAKWEYSGKDKQGRDIYSAPAHYETFEITTTDIYYTKIK